MADDDSNATNFLAILAIVWSAGHHLLLHVVRVVEARDVDPVAVETRRGTDLLKVAEVRSTLNDETVDLDLSQSLQELVLDDLIDQLLEGGSSSDGDEHSRRGLAILRHRSRSGGVHHHTSVIALGILMSSSAKVAELGDGIRDSVGEEVSGALEGGRRSAAGNTLGRLVEAAKLRLGDLLLVNAPNLAGGRISFPGVRDTERLEGRDATLSGLGIDEVIDNGIRGAKLRSGRRGRVLGFFRLAITEVTMK